MYVCALLSKTSTSILPVAILLILWWKQGKVSWKQLLAVLPFVVVGILSGAFTLWLEKYEKGALGGQFTLPFLSRLLVAGRSFWLCLGKLLWPARLTFIYPRWTIDPTVGWAYFYPLSVVVLGVALWGSRRLLGRAPLAAAIYFTVAFPALVIIQMLYMMQFSFVSDHWQYLGSMSVIPLGVSAAVTALNRWATAFRRVGLVIGTIVLAALGLLTWRQGYIYQNLETLWRDTLTKNPDAWMAHNNLGRLFDDRGNVPEAMGHYEQALRLKPDYADAHNNLGVALVQLGKIQEAMTHWEQALRIKPNFADAHYNLGRALMRLGRVQEAIGHWEQAAWVRAGRCPGPQ